MQEMYLNAFTADLSSRPYLPSLSIRSSTALYSSSSAFRQSSSSPYPPSGTVCACVRVCVCICVCVCANRGEKVRREKERNEVQKRNEKKRGEIAGGKKRGTHRRIRWSQQDKVRYQRTFTDREKRQADGILR